jgi:DNA-directed RNA polymerase subunit RPC12/RpoP
VATHVSMKPIPAPPAGKRAVYMAKKGTIVFRGRGGGLSYLCGRCSATLAEDIKGGQLNNLVLKCKACGTFNEPIQ